jgi:hypothetical protein
MPGAPTCDGIIIEVIEVGPFIFRWSMRKGDDNPFLHSRGSFAEAKHAEANARSVVLRASKKIAYVETVRAA